MSVALCVALGGCSRDARLVGRNVRSVTVKPVTHYGVTLDENATPKQVAYVLTRAIRDDFLAATSQDREASLDVQFDICAANVINARNSTAVSRDEFVYTVVYHWTPTVSHYVRGFDTDWAKAEPRLVQSAVHTDGADGGGTKKCEVRMELADPDGDPGAGVVMIAWLARDKGLWRVTHVGFDRTRRKLATSG
ncbi:MAG: hypothetical protein IH989_06155 [Planctomycetes bacterium]|nr:hypothetical protein [Planctomycetota bacterium]